MITAVLDKLILETFEKKPEQVGKIVVVETEESKQKKPGYGKIISHGPGRSDNPMHPAIKVGATICFPRFAGHEVRDHGKNYKIILQQDVLYVE